MTVYPTWDAPAALFPQGITNPQVNWSKADANLYLEWIMSTTSDRIAAMFGVLGVKQSDNASADLSIAGEGAYMRLRQAEFSDSTGSHPRLREPGRALAADMGLLVAHALLNSDRGRLSWKVCRESKRHADYNLPVLCGGSNFCLEPIGGSIANAHGCIRGTRNSDIWLRTYQHWVVRLHEA